MEDQIRRASIARALPANPAAPSGLQRFQRRFFCSEARGIMLRRCSSPAVAITAFRQREDALAKARRALQHFANSRNFDNVYADGNDHK